MSENQNNQGGGYQRKPWNQGNNQGGGGNRQWQGGGNRQWQGKGVVAGVRFHNTLAESKLRLSAEKISGMTYKNDFPSQLSPWLVDTNPRLVVRPNIEGERDEIIIRLDPINAEMLFDMLLTATESQPGFRHAIVLKNKDNETKRVYDETRVVFGRHQENGVVYMEVTPMDEDSRLKITFNFASRVFTELLYGDGVKQSPADTSVIVARSWARRLNRLYDIALMTMPIKRRPWQGNQQGNQQGAQQNNQGGQRQQWQNRQERPDNQRQEYSPPRQQYSQNQGQAPAPETPPAPAAPAQRQEYIQRSAPAEESWDDSAL